MYINNKKAKQVEENVRLFTVLKKKYYSSRDFVIKIEVMTHFVRIISTLAKY